MSVNIPILYCVHNLSVCHVRKVSTKSVARGGRETGVTRTHQLRIETKLPAQNVVLTGVENKKQLISIIFGELIRDRLFHVECTKGHKLVVTGEQPCPVETTSEEVKT